MVLKTSVNLHFLGTGGGRFVTGLQQRRTAGIAVETDETVLHLDPGPGALVYLREELDRHDELEAVMVSHGHLDHSNDAEALIEMAAEAEGNPVRLFANETAIEGRGEIERAVSRYHQEMCAEVEKLKDTDELEFRGLQIESQTMFHGDPETQGIVLEDSERRVGFWTDSEFSDELLDFYTGCDVLVVYCGRPRGKPVPGHITVEDAREIIEHVGPSTSILTHFGKAFIDGDMEEQQNWLDGKVESKIIFAEDGMTFPGDRSLRSF